MPIYEVGKHEGLLYLTMRCIDGPSLGQLLTAQRLSVHDAARIARQVADALAYAHAQGVVHRDIKPDNILLDRHGHVLVTDFGIAKAAQAAAGIGQLTAEGMILGSPAYMSPEQAAGEPVDGRSDIYSLGIVLYQMLAGETPFAGGSAAALLAKQLTAVPAPIRQVRADVSSELAFVLDRMLAKPSGDRFQTASEASAALIAALPAAATGRLRVPLRRRLPAVMVKSLVGLGLAGCLAAVAFVAGALAVSFVLFSTSPRLVVSAPAPDSLTAALRQSGVLDADDRVQLAFVPGGHQDSSLLVISDAHVAFVTPRGIHRYQR
ncbi:MAG: serine/threonine-protein kinase, partial [Burkholderiales bacterium]